MYIFSSLFLFYSTGGVCGGSFFGLSRSYKFNLKSDKY